MTGVVEILERHLEGKLGDPALCEDRVVVAEGVAAVVDGATDVVSGQRILFEGQTVSSGWLAAEIVARAVAELGGGQDPASAVTEISRRLEEAFQTLVRGEADGQRPRAGVVVADVEAGVVWRVGDCGFRMGETVNQGGRLIDEVNSAFRAAVLATYEPEELEGGGDPGLEAIKPLLAREGRLANQVGEFGFGVLNGTPVPEEFIEVYPIEGREVILASDGYPEIRESLEESEAALAALLGEDPWCVGPLRSTKGLVAGGSSYDDRAWLRIRI